MAETKAAVLKAAKLIVEGGSPFVKANIKITPYDGGKVRVWGLTNGNLPDVLLLGDALPTDDADAKKATEYFSQDVIDSMLKGVVELAESKASGDMEKPTVKTADPSS